MGQVSCHSCNDPGCSGFHPELRRTYSEQSTEKRMATAGDIAQGQAEAFFGANGIKWEHFGTEHHPESVFYGPYERYRPDYLVDYVDGKRLVEVMSISPGSAELRIGPTLKLKVPKLEALRWWDHDVPTSLWLYDPGAREGGFVSLGRLSQLIFECRFGTGAFVDEQTRPYFRFNKGDLRAVWHPTTTFVQSEWKRHESGDDA